MREFLIGIGKCSFAYLYLFGAAISKLLQDFLLSLEDINKNLKYNIFGIETVLNNHKLVRVFYKYFSFILFGLIFYYISINKKTKKQNTNKKKKKDYNETIASNIKKYIVNKISLNKHILFRFLFVCGFYSLINVARKIVNIYKLSELDFWIFNIVFVSLYMNKFFGIQIYKHQKCSLIFIFLTNFILLSIAAYFPIKKDDQNIFTKFGWKCIFIFILYIIFSWISSLTKVASKKLMDIYYISIYKIIYYIGIFGSIFILIVLIFTSNISCEKQSYCKVIKEDNTTKYLDSIPVYFSEFRKRNKKGLFKDFYLEIFVLTPFFIFANFLEFYCEMLIILFLNPNYILISDCIYFGTSKLLKFNSNKEENNSIKFCMEYIAEILALMGYIIYLEIVELRFCGLNDDIKKNIMERSIRESVIRDIDLNLSSSMNDNSDDDSDEEEKIKIEMISKSPS